MATKDAVIDGTAKGFGSAAGKFIWIIGTFVVMIIVGIAIWMMFGEDIKDGYDFTRQVDTHESQLISLDAWRKTIEQGNLDRQKSEINLQNRLNLLEAQAKSIAALSTKNDVLEDEVETLKTTVSNLQAELDRAEEDIEENSIWRVGQEKRATQRVKDHALRDERLTTGEQVDVNHEHVINQIRDILIEDGHEIEYIHHVFTSPRSQID